MLRRLYSTTSAAIVYHNFSDKTGPGQFLTIHTTATTATRLSIRLSYKTAASRQDAKFSPLNADGCLETLTFRRVSRSECIWETRESDSLSVMLISFMISSSPW